MLLRFSVVKKQDFIVALMLLSTCFTGQYNLRSVSFSSMASKFYLIAHVSFFLRWLKHNLTQLYSLDIITSAILYIVVLILSYDNYLSPSTQGIEILSLTKPLYSKFACKC